MLVKGGHADIWHLPSWVERQSYKFTIPFAAIGKPLLDYPDIVIVANKNNRAKKLDMRSQCRKKGLPQASRGFSVD